MHLRSGCLRLSAGHDGSQRQDGLSFLSIEIGRRKFAQAQGGSYLFQPLHEHRKLEALRKDKAHHSHARTHPTLVPVAFLGGDEIPYQSLHAVPWFVGTLGTRVSFCTFRLGIPMTLLN